MTDPRRFAPSVARNRAPILDVLRPLLPGPATVLEVASGSGEHAAWFAAALPKVTFQPTDADAEARASIDAWAAEQRLPNVRPALALDAAGEDWPAIAADLVLCINMIHIAPWSATLGLLRGSARVLAAGGLLVTYGPYRRDGAHTAPSNAAFDDSLRARDPRWGMRDLEQVATAAGDAGFAAPDIHAMPANNLMLVFRRQASDAARR